MLNRELGCFSPYAALISVRPIGLTQAMLTGRVRRQSRCGKTWRTAVVNQGLRMTSCGWFCPSVVWTIRVTHDRAGPVMCRSTNGKHPNAAGERKGRNEKP